ncbi:NTP transferase domain-containing protein, partial [candidate division KSB1 bacterium]|nr:NTP transferase domain-containing protein [candidate division KSB1 bacterium]
MIPVIVLCGGLGKRLRSVVSDRPKVMARIGGKPYLHYLLNSLQRQGFRKIYLSTGYRAGQIESYIDKTEWPFSIQSIREETPLGTGGAILHVLRQAGIEGTFIAMNGDSFVSASIAELLQFHQQHQANASLALVQVGNPARYGSVRLEDSEISAFEEKREDLKGPAWINAGIYSLEAKLFDRLPANQPLSIERDIFPQWVGKGLYGCRFADAQFLDIGTPEDLNKAESILHKVQG